MSVFIQNLIDSQRGELHVCGPEDTVQKAAVTMKSNGIGAVPVCDEENRLLGILSERDIVYGVASPSAKPSALTVQELMTRDAVTCSPSDLISDAIRRMFQHRVRHLPVMADDRVCGMISLRAAMEARLRSRKWTGTHRSRDR